MVGLKKLSLGTAGLIGLLYINSSSCQNSQNQQDNQTRNLEDTIKTEKSDASEKNLKNPLFIDSTKTQKQNNNLWEKIDTGLYYSEINSPINSEFGDSKINVLKINPKYYNFHLISVKQNNEYSKTAEAWATEKKLIALINAGMFMEDKTNTGFMKNYNFFNNKKIASNYNSIVSFNRTDESVPEFQIIDLKCQDWNVLKEKYNSFSQGIRMINCNQRNVWGQQDKKWSMSVIGEDKEGNALFIFSRSPYSVHDFINILLKSPLNIKKAMYLEGGPEASFYLNSKEKKIKKCGSYETGFNENNSNEDFWLIPNIIGITKK